MKNLVTITVLMTSLVGGTVQAEVPQALARWMLKAPRTTTPFPAVERDAAEAAESDASTATLARWAKQYAWQFQPSAQPEVPQELPPVEEESGQLRFAAGAIVLPLPSDWQVSELDHLRHVRLYLTLDKLISEEHFSEGVWISYHVLSPPPQTESELRDLVQRRCADTLPPDADLSEARLVRLNGRLAVQQPYLLRSTSGVSGEHLLVMADWGVAEIQTRYQGNANVQRIADVVSSIEVGTARDSHFKALQDAAPNSDIVGAWKAERARLILKADGAIELHHDRERLQQIEQAGLVRPARRLRGRYIAESDVLRVHWEDGSELNLRFDVSEGALMLTDHHGRVSQLHRLFE